MNWSRKEEKSKGITLIALVITIIILLILAGISIAMLTGQNGLLTKANIASEETKKVTYKEVLELLGSEIRPEKVLENLNTKEFMDRYEGKIEKEIQEGNNLKEATLNRKNDETIYVTTKENWVYKITENKVEFLGKKGENSAPALQETDIDLVTNPEKNTYTKGNVKVQIIVTNQELKKYTLQYSEDGISWTNYVGEFEVTENGPIHARLMNELDETGASATKTISNIDREDPNEAEVTFSPTSTDTDNSITATVTQSDSGSGVAITSCKWDYRKSEQPIGTNEADYKGGPFKDSPEPISLQTYIAGTYYLHVLTIDNVGNKKETVKGPIEVTQGSYQEIFSDIYTKTETYTDENGKTARIPEGFAVGVTPNINTIDGGLVITDQIDANHKSTGNEFVWIPVNDKANFKRVDWETQGSLQNYVSSGNFSEPCNRGSQEEKNLYTTMYEGVTREENKGFYIGRYEASKEDEKVVVKKNKRSYGNVPWSSSGNMTVLTGGAVQFSREFINDKPYKGKIISNLTYGVQMDAALSFQGPSPYWNNNEDSTAEDWTGSTVLTGSNEKCRVKNIYDLTAGLAEWTWEAGVYVDSRVYREKSYASRSKKCFTSTKYLWSNIEESNFRI